MSRIESNPVCPCIWSAIHVYTTQQDSARRWTRSKSCAQSVHSVTVSTSYKSSSSPSLLPSLLTFLWVTNTTPWRCRRCLVGQQTGIGMALHSTAHHTLYRERKETWSTQQQQQQQQQPVCVHVFLVQLSAESFVLSPSNPLKVEQTAHELRWVWSVWAWPKCV